VQEKIQLESAAASIQYQRVTQETLTHAQTRDNSYSIRTGIESRSMCNWS